MATRINNAKNFKGKSYVVTDELTNIINSLQYSAGKLYFNGGSVQNESGVGATSTQVDISDLIGFITSGKTANKIITTDASGNFAYINAITSEVASSGSTSATNIPNETAVRAAIDAVQQAAISVVGGDGIVVTSDGTVKTIATDIKLQKLGTATAGYASSYQLLVKEAGQDTYKAVGDTLNIPKDQFLEDAVFIAAATEGDVTASGETVELGKPCIKFTFAINTKDSSSAETGTSKVVYVNVKGLVDIYTAGNGINITSNVVTAVADTTDKIFISKGVSSSVMSVTSDGVKATGIQAAIDLATENAYAKTSTAISAVNAQVEAFESSVNTQVSSAITSVNGKVDSAVSNVNIKVGSAITAIDGKVDGAVTAVNGAVTSTVNNINTKVDNAITAVDSKVDGAVTAVNGAVTTTVGAVNTAVGSAVSAVESNVASVVTNVNTAISATVSSVNTQVSAVASQVVQIVDDTITITSDNISANETAKTVTLTGITGKVLAVYDADGIQIYPTIQKVNSTYTLTAEYGPSATVDSAWSVLHTSAVNYTNATVTSANGVTAAGYAPATVTSATAPATVTYSSASAASATSPATVTYSSADDGTDASYTDASYDNGTTVAGLDYKQA